MRHSETSQELDVPEEELPGTGAAGGSTMI